MLKIENPSQSLEVIRRDGFVEIPKAIPTDALNRIAAAVERPFERLTLNGTRGHVVSGAVKYLFQTFAWSPDILGLYTDSTLVGMAAEYSGEQVNISNHRIYRAMPSRRKKMKWHRDNKIDIYNRDSEQFETSMVPNHPGLIFIAYLSDVENGGTQIVRGSHNIPDGGRETWTESEVESLSNEVVTFNNRPAGTMLIYDYRCLHRAQPYRKGAVRTSIFGQFSPQSFPAGEPIFISSEYLSGLNEEQMRVLNFGRKPTTENWPIGTRLQNSVSALQYLAGR